ncbi:MAG: methylthioribose-1-phosphate isomerase [candidate division Zixibacteria bacterium SM1_73]|nr:MAG: methylthioribose-1-phosphate isomerase [candidate division Zixibacteria bacterium SM1_73]
MNFKTLEWTDGELRILDQTKLPLRVEYLDCKSVEQVAEAIKDLNIRGAPAIGIAAAFGVVVGMQNRNYKSWEEYQIRLNEVVSILGNTRPTAVNLFWALDRMKNVVEVNKEKSFKDLNELLLKESISIHEEDKLMCQRIGEHGASLLKEGDTVLTHCNAGALATGGIGTALGIIYTAQNQGKRIKVFADETRPVLQGARLTVWELQQEGVDVTLICDNTAAFLMRTKKIDCVIVGADRVAKNGDVANKIGTYNLAVLAKAHDTPFYVAAPTSSFDPAIESGEKIKIEERSKDEVTNWFGKRIAPSGTKVWSPAFDVTPAELITAYITEEGIKEGLKFKV